MDVRDRLATDLREAMRARDRARVAVLRTALAAIANAEAPPVDDSGPAPAPNAGYADVARLDLTDADVAAVLAAEVSDREDTIARVEAAGGDADTLRAELSILRAYVT